MAAYHPQVNRVFIYGLGTHSEDARVHPGFPLEGQQIYADDDFPGIIVETLTGYWEAVVTEYRSVVPGAHGSHQTTLYRHQIDEAARAREIRRSREPHGGDLF
jgi:hypothetical protein